MPLTAEAKANCIVTINGNDGIISSIGRINRNIIDGDADAIINNPDQHQLDVLSRIFFRAAATTYISIIEVLDANKIYVSFPGGLPYQALTQIQVNSLKQSLANLLQNLTNENKITLFRLMYESRNDILMKHLIEFRNEQDVKDRNGEDSYINGARKLIHPKPFDHEMNLAFTQFTAEKFDALLPNIEEIAPYVAKEFIVMDHTAGPHDLNWGVHVEVKGVYFAKFHNAASRIFNIGLANKDNPEVGCCTGCSAEFVAFHNVHDDYSFHRTADFNRNFPPTNYKASQLPSEDEVFVEFAREIRDRCNSVIQDTPQLQVPDIAEHAFFAAANEVAPLGAQGVIPIDI